jgi:hypothetical protein
MRMAEHRRNRIEIQAYILRSLAANAAKGEALFERRHENLRPIDGISRYQWACASAGESAEEKACEEGFTPRTPEFAARVAEIAARKFAQIRAKLLFEEEFASLEAETQALHEIASRLDVTLEVADPYEKYGEEAVRRRLEEASHDY